MFHRSLKILTFIFCIFLCVSKTAYSEIVKDFKVSGNQRVSNETIILFSEISINDKIDSLILNRSLKNLYNTNFFEDVSIKINNNILVIIIRNLATLDRKNKL